MRGYGGYYIRHMKEFKFDADNIHALVEIIVNYSNLKYLRTKL